MSVIEKILEEIEKYRKAASDSGDFNVSAAYEKSMSIIRKHMDAAEYPYITGKDIEADPPASKEFLAECREVAKKYEKNCG